jgi:hypothetical protein
MYVQYGFLYLIRPKLTLHILQKVCFASNVKHCHLLLFSSCQNMEHFSIVEAFSEQLCGIFRLKVQNDEAFSALGSFIAR